MNCIFPVHSFNDVLAWCKRTGLCHYMHPSYLLLIRYKEDNVLHSTSHKLLFEVKPSIGGGGKEYSLEVFFFSVIW